MSKALVKILFLTIYTFGYLFLAVASTGGGHGNFYILIPIVSWLFIFIAVFCVGKQENFIYPTFFITTMLLHYLVIALFFANYPYNEDKGWTKSAIPIIPIVFYVIGQLLIWGYFVYEFKNNRSIQNAN